MATPLKCPICKKAVDADSIGQPGSFAPFCSERCRTIDLGRWLDGKYQIPVKDDDESHDGDATDDFLR
jgi:endogenous inhibitor of DNA gyrase (YacG/DUF329 family)